MRYAVLIGLGLMVLPCSVRAQVSCTTIGASTFCSDGSTGTRIGSHEFWNDGTTVNRLGSSTFIFGDRERPATGYLGRSRPSVLDSLDED